MWKKILITFFVVIGISTIAFWVKAGSNQNVTGWLWGGSNTNLGWISTNDVSGGGNVTYGLNIPSGNGNVTGYAWSSNIGWIDFEPQNHCGKIYKARSCQAPDGSRGGVARNKNNLIGWARIVGIAQESSRGNSGGWDGWIKMHSTARDPITYGVTVNTNTGQLSNYAWSNELGWIDFSKAKTTLSTLIICPSFLSINKGGIGNLKAYYSNGNSNITCSNHTGATDVTDSSNWSSNNSSIARVNNTTSKGRVTGVNVGKTTVTGTYSGLSASSNITIVSAPTVCGDGFKQAQAGEECDDGSNNGSCPASCSSSCTLNDCRGNEWKEVTP